jgi:hypothetical protein
VLASLGLQAGDTRGYAAYLEARVLELGLQAGRPFGSDLTIDTLGLAWGPPYDHANTSRACCHAPQRG